MTVRWCCTAEACLLGQQWERRQQRGYRCLQSQDGSPQLSAEPANQGHPLLCSPHSAGMYTWNYAGHSVSSEETFPPAVSTAMHHQCFWAVLTVTSCKVSNGACLTKWSKTLRASRARSGYCRISAKAWPIREDGLLSFTSLPISMYPGKKK